MANFNAPVKVFIKSKNSSTKIINNYNTSLIFFSILACIINLLLKNNEIVYSFIKTLIISLTITILISYIFNIIKKEYSIKKLYTEDNIISIAIILSLFAINTNIYIHLIAILVTIIIKNIYKNINISSVLYGILVITIYRYMTNSLITPITITSNENLNSIINYIFNIKYLCPGLSILSFIYLFHHKSIKYSLVFSYILTFITIMFLYGIFDNFNFYYSLSTLINYGIIFLAVYTLTDYKVTPTISEGNTIYGIILGIITTILLFIIPDFAVAISFIIGPVFTKAIDKISPTLKYNNRLYIGLIITSIAIMILTALTLNIIF